MYSMLTNDGKIIKIKEGLSAIRVSNYTIFAEGIGEENAGTAVDVFHFTAEGG